MYFIMHRTGNDSSFWREKIPLLKKKKVLKNVRNKLNHKITEKIELSGCTLRWNGLTIYGNMLQRLKYKGILFFT